MTASIHGIEASPAAIVRPGCHVKGAHSCRVPALLGAAVALLALAGPSLPATAAGAAVPVAARGVTGSAAASRAETHRHGSVYARVTDDRVVLGNALAERRWSRAPFRTEALVDRRGPDLVWSAGRRDFSLTLGALELGSEAFRAEGVAVERLERGGLRVSIRLRPPPGAPLLRVTRVAEAYPGVAGFRTHTILLPRAPAALAGARLEEASVGERAATLHSFRAGGDWREPGWEGPALTIGDPHAGSWRETRRGDRGEPLEGPGQWLSVGGGRSLFMVVEGNDFPSARLGYDGAVGGVGLEYGRDAVVFGPFEEQLHVENPTPAPGRMRVLRPGQRLELPAVFTGFGRGAGDEAWQFHRYLLEHRLAPYARAVSFNSNGTDSDRISTGAKDDMDYATVREVAPIARRLGVETFILDDGWQARSGDWQPDSPRYPEPRWDGDPESKFEPRFPDSELRAVREAIAPMELGLWMSPTFFHPSSRAFREHPEWACAPVGDALAAYNAVEPDDGSNEAGIGAWSRAALPHVERRIREAIEGWGVTYFKLDFLLWLDCADGRGDVRDLYELHDAFLAMLDRLIRDHPQVTFQVDETNDYRLFPFESVSRGPTWFQNGGPPPERMLHNLWSLSPFVPSFALGQSALANGNFERYPVDTLMAAALLSHITFFSDLRELPPEVIDAVGRWTAFYRRNRELLDGVVYPLEGDPIDGGWTALQAWDPEAADGALLAFRQGSEDSSRRIPLTNVPPGRRFDLFAGVGERHVGTVSSAELSAGIEVELAEERAARVLLIRPAAEG